MGTLEWTITYFLAGSVINFLVGAFSMLKVEKEEPEVVLFLLVMWPVLVMVIPYTLGDAWYSLRQREKLEERVDGGKD